MNKFKKFLYSVFNCLKTVICYFLFLFVIFSLVYGCFYFGARGYNEGQSNLNYNLSTADTTQSNFYGSNIALQIGLFTSSNTNPGSNNYVSYSDDYIPTQVNLYNYGFNVSCVFSTYYYGSDVLSYTDYGPGIWHNFSFKCQVNQQDRYVLFSAYYDADFNFNVSSVRLYTVENYGGSSSYYGCHLNYYDNNNNVFQFSFCFKAQNYSYSGATLSDRTYIINADGNSFYLQGYNNGYNQGYSQGSSAGYNDGFSNGQISGYSNGYNHGVEDANQYTFLSLIGAVIDAPVTAFTSLLNFNVFGFNMLSMLTGLLTVGIIIAIIRFIMGRS